MSKIRHAALVGFMAAGKTTIGRLLARELGVLFVDTDASIVARHGPIAELFARSGEAGFRAAEHAAVCAALAGDPAVLALGGGAITFPPTRAALRVGALCVYLEIPAEELFARLQRAVTIRPLLGSEPTLERVQELLGQREPLYRTADVVVTGPRASKVAFAREIAARLREAGAFPRTRSARRGSP